MSEIIGLPELGSGTRHNSFSYHSRSCDQSGVQEGRHTKSLLHALRHVLKSEMRLWLTAAGAVIAIAAVGGVVLVEDLGHGREASGPGGSGHGGQSGGTP